MFPPWFGQSVALQVPINRVSLLMKRSLLTLFAVALIGGALPAQTLRVDFNSNQDQGGDSALAGPPEASIANHNQAGWSSYHANHEVNAEFGTATYGSITVTPDWPNTTDVRVEQMIDRNNQDDLAPFQNVIAGSNDANWNNAVGDINLVTDWLGTDTRTGSGGNGDWDGVTGTPTYMTLRLGGLSDATYNWRSYHHDTENVHGFFRVEVSVDGGATYTQLADGYMSDSTPLGTPDSTDAGYSGPQVGPDANLLISTYDTSFDADGVNDVVFRFAPYSNSGVHRQLWGINGFVLEQVPIPEPSTVTLALLAVATIGWQARRKMTKK
jgi:hypothetical protein